MGAPAKIHLYHFPGSRSDRVKMLLRLLEFPYEQTIIDIRNRENKAPEYLQVNPLGVVPGLRINGAPVAECIAQMIILADMDPSHRLAPKLNDPVRLLYTQWMVMLTSSLEPMVAPVIRDPRSPDHRAAAEAAVKIQSTMLVGPYCLGDQLSALDVAVHWSLRFLDDIDLLRNFPVWLEYMQLVSDNLDWNTLNQ